MHVQFTTLPLGSLTANSQQRETQRRAIHLSLLEERVQQDAVRAKHPPYVMRIQILTTRSHLSDSRLDAEPAVLRSLWTNYNFNCSSTTGTTSSSTRRRLRRRCRRRSR